MRKLSSYNFVLNHNLFLLANWFFFKNFENNLFMYQSKTWFFSFSLLYWTYNAPWPYFAYFSMHYWSTIKNIKFQILIKNVKKKYGNFIIKYRRISNRNRPIVTKYRRFCLTYLSIIIGYRTNFYRYYRTIDNEPIIDIYHHRSTTL